MLYALLQSLLLKSVFPSHLLSKLLKFQLFLCCAYAQFPVILLKENVLPNWCQFIEFWLMGRSLSLSVSVSSSMLLDINLFITQYVRHSFCASLTLCITQFVCHSFCCQALIFVVVCSLLLCITHCCCPSFLCLFLRCLIESGFKVNTISRCVSAPHFDAF